MSNQENTTSNRRNVYSNGDLTQFDNVSSALGFRFFNSVGSIDFSPIDPEKIGTKEFVKGMYDHENRHSVYISGHTAIKLLAAIDLLRTTEGLKSTKVEFGKGKSASFYNPNTVQLKLAGKKIDTTNNYVLSMSSIVDDEEIVTIHVLQNTEVELTTVKKKVSTVTVNSGLDSLIAFLKEVVNLSTGAYRQGAALATPRTASTNTSASSKAKAFASFYDEDNDSEDNNSEENESSNTSSSKSSNKNTKKSSKPVKNKKKSLEDEFNDVD